MRKIEHPAEWMEKPFIRKCNYSNIVRFEFVGTKMRRNAEIKNGASCDDRCIGNIC